MNDTVRLFILHMQPRGLPPVVRFTADLDENGHIAKLHFGAMNEPDDRTDEQKQKASIVCFHIGEAIGLSCMNKQKPGKALLHESKRKIRKGHGHRPGKSK